MEKLSLIVALFFIVVPAAIFAQKINSKEKKIIQLVEKNHPDAIAFLERVVNINSGTMNREGVKKVGMVFQKAFDGIGFKTKWIDMPSGMQRAGHIRRGNLWICVLLKI